MFWGAGQVLSGLGDEVRDFVSNLWAEKADQGVAGLLAPVAPYNRSTLLTPVVTVVGVIGVLVLSGVAVASLAAMTTALIVIYFLLTEVFGYEIQLSPMPGSAA